MSDQNTHYYANPYSMTGWFRQDGYGRMAHSNFMTEYNGYNGYPNYTVDNRSYTNGYYDNYDSPYYRQNDFQNAWSLDAMADQSDQHYHRANDYNPYPIYPRASTQQMHVAVPLSVFPGSFGDIPSLPINNGRTMRNLAEKMRRDKLNGFISDLSKLVPMVTDSTKKLDKTSILRLSAAFLRINYLSRIVRKHLVYIPNFCKYIDWTELLLDGMEGMLLVVTGAGSIVFISPSVENKLGHVQNDLYGQSLFSITHSNDHESLTASLTPNGGEELPDELNSTGKLAGMIEVLHMADEMLHGDGERMVRQRRSFYIRLQYRSTSRSERKQYELFHVFGSLRMPSNAIRQPSTKRFRKDRGALSDFSEINKNEITLIAVARPFTAECSSSVQNIDLHREEYVTRHLLDGRIVFTDQRILLVAGYVPEEVVGTQAFGFMHADDVGCVLFSLRQMFQNGNCGTSCYRLRTKIGDFIYLKTYGYLEIDPKTKCFASFICINKIIREDEGAAILNEMRRTHRYITSSDIAQKKTNDRTSNKKSLEDLNKTIRDLINSIPCPKPTEHYEKLFTSDPNYAKVKQYSAQLPPVLHQAALIPGIDPASIPMSKRLSMSFDSKDEKLRPFLPEPVDEFQTVFTQTAMLKEDVVHSTVTTTSVSSVTQQQPLTSISMPSLTHTFGSIVNYSTPTVDELINQQAQSSVFGLTSDHAQSTAADPNRSRTIMSLGQTYTRKSGLLTSLNQHGVTVKPYGLAICQQDRTNTVYSQPTSCSATLSTSFYQQNVTGNSNITWTTVSLTSTCFVDDSKFPHHLRTTTNPNLSWTVMVPTESIPCQTVTSNLRSEDVFTSSVPDVIYSCREFSQPSEASDAQDRPSVLRIARKCKIPIDTVQELEKQDVCFVEPSSKENEQVFSVEDVRQEHSNLELRMGAQHVQIENITNRIDPATADPHDNQSDLIQIQGNCEATKVLDNRDLQKN